MNNFGEQLNIVIDNLAEKLGITADRVWPMLLKQAQLEGTAYIVGFIVFGVIALMLWITAPFAWRTNEDFGGWVYVFAFIITITVVLMIFYSPWKTAVWNPEYYALQQLMGMIPSTK
jgi:hypothetical protein